MLDLRAETEPPDVLPLEDPSMAEPDAVADAVNDDAAADDLAAAHAEADAPANLRGDMLASMLQRMQAEVDAASGQKMSQREAEQRMSMYSEDSLRQRVDLLGDPEVVQALEDLWQAANSSNEDEIIDNVEYLEMHRRVVLSLQPTVTPAEAEEASEEDWVRDSEGKPGLDRERFYMCWFELADLWTESIDPDEYVEFLQAEREMITRRLPDGRVVWKDEKEVMRGHYERRRELGLPIDEDNNLPLCLSTWHKWFKEREAGGPLLEVRPACGPLVPSLTRRRSPSPPGSPDGRRSSSSPPRSPSPTSRLLQLAVARPPRSPSSSPSSPSPGRGSPPPAGPRPPDPVARLLSELAATPRSCRARLEALRRLLHAGQEAWWAMPIVLRGECAWDERSLVTCADMLGRTAAAGAADAFAANALAEATAAQPAIAALVAIGRGDQRGASLALGRCERAEQVRVVRIVSKAYGKQRAG